MLQKKEETPGVAQDVHKKTKKIGDKKVIRDGNKGKGSILKRFFGK
mgnify:CR=1 FL=1